MRAEFSARGPHGTLPWLAIVDHTVKDLPVRSTLLMWVRNKEAAVRLVNGHVREGEVRALRVVDPSQNINAQQVALNIMLPLGKPSGGE